MFKVMIEQIIDNEVIGRMVLVEDFEDIKKYLNKKVDVLDHNDRHWVGILRSVKYVDKHYELSIDYSFDDMLIFEDKDIKKISLCFYIQNL